jgi:hypothetical protein
VAQWQLGPASLCSGALREGLRELESASEFAGRRPRGLAELSFARARVGDLSGARSILDELTTLARSSYVSPYDLALCCTGLGDRSGAIDYMEHAYRECVMPIISIGDPELDELRKDPRFVSLVERLRLPGEDA